MINQFNITDIVLVGLFFYFFIRGWFQGILKTLLGPISLLIGSIAAVIYYNFTKNLILSLFISILSPFTLHIISSHLLNVWQKNNAAQNPKSFISPGRFIASLINVTWNSVWIILTLILFILIPFDKGWLSVTKENIKESKTYIFLERFSGQGFTSKDFNLDKTINRYRDPKFVGKIQKTKEYEEVVGDEKIKQILLDEEILKLLQDKDYAKLMSNPKFQAILNDEELLKKFMTLYQRTLKE